MALNPSALANAAHAAWNCGLPNAVKDLADLVEGFGGVPLMDVIRVEGMAQTASTAQQALAKESAE
jgi:UDP-N-acetylglucosamine--N-acetylmuramyl-(pentapeptide) pyrophosphoryl-undecaprenol N-acetylglucosamine transferase